MPELPEVEVVRAGLAPAVTGSQITSVTVHDQRALTRHVPGAAHFAGALEGAQITAAARRGKFLWLPLDDHRHALIAHLGMSGQMLLRIPDAPTERHERVRIEVEHPTHGRLAIVFADQRTFGSLAVDELVPSGGEAPGGFGADLALIPSQVAHIARDPLDPAFDDAAFFRAALKRRSAIKRILLDQSLISGIGNIYADESLWAAKIHPETQGDALSARSLRLLLDEARLVLQRALAEGGTSFDAQYVNVNGQAGYFSRYLHAYGRAGEPCNRCGTPITRMAFMNRSSFFCQRCQKPRAGNASAA